MFNFWDQKTENRECTAKNSAENGYFHKDKFNWTNKKNKAIFRGGNTGENFDQNHKPRSRLKLL